MAKIYLLKYNNYHNRTLKAETTLADYLSSVGASGYRLFTGINFNKNDGVWTEQTINFGLAETEFEANYALVCTDAENPEIISKWFVMESRWNRQKQLILSLYRDVKVDFLNEYGSAPFYCEKGPADGLTDPLIYNSEGQSFNKILKSRTLLQKNTLTVKRQIVGFVDKTWKGGIVYKGVSYENWEDFPLYKYANSLIIKDGKIGLTTRISKAPSTSPSSGTTVYRIAGYTDGTYAAGAPVIFDSGVYSRYNNNTIDVTLANRIASEWLAAETPKYIGQIYNDLEKGLSYVSSDILGHWSNGDLFFIGKNQYRLNLTVGAVNDFATNQGADYYDDELESSFREFGEGNWIDYDTYVANIDAVVTGKKIAMSFTATSQTIGGIDLTGERYHTGQPYDIFYIQDSPEAREFCSYFASQYGGGNVLYDLQICPYAPSGGDLSTAVQIAAGQFLYWATSDNDKGTLKHPAIATYNTALDLKKGSNMDMCRIVSPDNSSYWEFNPAQLGGVPANSIKYEITFIPFATYIHIFPTFGGIYGNVNIDYAEPYAGESRGLVCVDDFSMAYSTSNWATFKLQNSAYEKSHERVMRNMSVTQRAERTQEQIDIALNTAQAALGGALQGGGKGAAVAGGASLIGGAIQYNMNEALRKEEKSYAEDMYNYQLENIQAQAQPLAKSNSLAVGNSFFPYVEYYTATDAEKTIFENRIAQHGWSLGIVTTFNAMKTRAAGNNFTKLIKGRIIRMNIEDDAHICSAINDELQKGVFIP